MALLHQTCSACSVQITSSSANDLGILVKCRAARGVRKTASRNGTTQERNVGEGHDVNVTWESSLPLHTIALSLIHFNIYAITKLFLRSCGIVVAECS